MLVQKVEEQILIPLDQPLRVDLSVFKLLISVSLDSLEESAECLLLLLPEKGLLPLNVFVESFTSLLSFLCLHLFALHAQDLGLFVSFRERELPDLVLHLHEPS